ncbi:MULTISPECIES: hypothetical protein [unclassified Bradyrhizobium]|nr:hypothetical protein [Bradyrhizobium sp. USDA 4541]MCP1854567.1 hypothetical protein [Bradyrhizobium sp. USDA 4541]
MHDYSNFERQRRLAANRHESMRSTTHETFGATVLINCFLPRFKVEASH